MSGNFLLVYQYNEVIFYVPLTLKSYEDKVLHFHQEVVYLEALSLMFLSLQHPNFHICLRN